MIHIGRHIKGILDQKGRSVIWLAEQIPCERSNVYNIFTRSDISISLLRRLSKILEYNFFKDLSDEYENEGK